MSTGIFHPVRVRQLSGDHIGRTVTARMVYPFSGPISYTGKLYAIEHRTDGTQITITDDHGPHAVILDPDDTIRMEAQA